MSCSRHTRTAISDRVPAATTLSTSGSLSATNPITRRTRPTAPKATEVTKAGGERRSSGGGRASTGDYGANISPGSHAVRVGFRLLLETNVRSMQNSATT